MQNPFLSSPQDQYLPTYEQVSNDYDYNFYNRIADMVLNENPIVPPTRPSPAKHWCFRWSNFPATYIEDLQSSFRRNGCIRWAFQPELCPTTGTPHIQGCVDAGRKIRPFPMFSLPQQIHWESCRGSWQSNVDYCTKDDTRQEGITPTIFKVWPTQPVRTIDPNTFYPWQTKVQTVLDSNPDERSIYWIWDPIGNVGKSAFIKYQVVHNDAIFCAGSKTADIINQVYNVFQQSKPIRIILWDLPRSSQGKISFNAIESLKNGLIANSKYETGQAVFNPPHIFIFSNHEPANIEELSADRWVIKEICNVRKDIQL
jgi:hypothetical protein